MRQRYYPRANQSLQDFSVRYPGSKMDPNVLVLHTTETKTWPGYKDGATAPTFTAYPDPATKRILWRQHFPVDMSSRALRNEQGGVQTNTLNAVQVELVGSCDPDEGIARGYYDWTKPDDWALRDLAEFVRWLDAEWPSFALQNAAPRGWLPYPSSYGNKNGQRLTFDEWRSAYGIVGHQHVPENSHGDPGDFPIERLISMAAHPAGSVTGKQYVAVPVTVGTFNNKGYLPMLLSKVNKGDYTFKSFALDLFGEQERWVPGQLGGFRKIFAAPFFSLFAPLTKSGTVVGHRTTMFERLTTFRFHASNAVRGVAGGRKFTGEVLKFKEHGATLTHFSLHPPPSAWSDRFKDGSRTKRALQREWWNAMNAAKSFAANQIRGGRDFVVIETDANASHAKVREALGREIAGKPVHIFTSKHGYKIDHIVVIGEIGKVVWEDSSKPVPSDHRPFAVRLWLRVPVEK